MGFKVYKKREFYLILLMGAFIFFLCRYIGNIISLIYFIFNINLNYVNNTRLDKIYDYRYSTPIIFFIISLLFLFIVKNFQNIKKVFRIIKEIIQEIFDDIRSVNLKRYKWGDFFYYFHPSNWNFKLVGLVLIALITRLFFSSRIYNENTTLLLEESQDLGLALSQGMPSHTHVFYNWIITLAYLLFGNIFIASERVGLFFSTLSVFPFYFFIKELTNKRTAFFSTLLFSLYPLHILLSKSAFNETPALFFVFLALFFFLKCLKSNSKIYTVLTIISLCIMGTLRMEFLILIPPICFVLLKTKRYNHLFIFCVFIFGFFICMLSLGYLFLPKYTELMTFLLYFVTKFKIDSNFLTQLISWATLAKLSLIPIPLRFLGLLGLVYFLTKKRMTPYFYIFIFVFLTYFIIDIITASGIQEFFGSLSFFQEESHSFFQHQRHTILVSTLFIPFIYLGCIALGKFMGKLFRRFSLLKEKSFIILLVCLAIISSVYELNAKMNHPLYSNDEYNNISPNMLDTIKWFKENSSEESIVFIAANHNVRDSYLLTVLLRESYKMNKPLSKISLSPYQTISGPKNMTELIAEMPYKEKSEEYELYLVLDEISDDKITEGCTTEAEGDYSAECVFESQKDKRYYGPKIIDSFFRVYRIHEKY